MRRGFLLALLGAMVAPVLGAPTINFTSTSGTTNAGHWTFTPAGPGTGTFRFDQPIIIDSAFGATADPIVGMSILLPALTVTGSGGNYAVAPQGDALITIRDAAGTVEFSGLLLTGPAQGHGTAGDAYPLFATDVVDITSPGGNATGSPAIARFLRLGGADLALCFVGAVNVDSAPFYTSFQQMVDQGFSGEGCLAGSLSSVAVQVIPSPGALVLGMTGVALLGWLRQRRMR